MANQRATKQKTKRPRLADTLEQMPPPERAARWYAKLSPELAEELAEIRARFHAGRLGHLSRSRIHQVCKEQLGITVCRSAFYEWLADGQEKECR